MKGSPGEDGDKGIVGNSGFRGKRGTKGATGEKGIPGSDIGLFAKVHYLMISHLILYDNRYLIMKLNFSKTLIMKLVTWHSIWKIEVFMFMSTLLQH